MENRLSIKTSPLELIIGGIPITIVNNHHEVLPILFNFANSNGMFVLMHVDAHHDLWCNNGLIEKPVDYEDETHDSETNVWSAEFYSSRLINEANFICYATHYDVVGAYYHFNPRWKMASALDGKILISESSNRSYERLLTVIHDERIAWDKQTPFVQLNPDPREHNQVISELRKARHPFVLDIDLDAFYCNEVYPESILKKKKDIESCYMGHLEKTKAFISQLPRPNIITISRSSTYIHFNQTYIQDIQDKTIEMLKRQYE